MVQGGTMGFYLRKSISVGPLRFNLSKSGIGVSTGIPGLRVGYGPRGNYIHMGRNGIYYRATLPESNNNNRNTDNQLPVNPRSINPQSPAISSSSIVMKEIESADINELHDSSSDELLTEIKNKQKKIAFFPASLILCVILFFLFISLDLYTWVYLVILVIMGIIVYLSTQIDQVRKSVVLFYEFEDSSSNTYQTFINIFTELINCQRVWHISSSGQINSLYDKKINAGASQVITRKQIQLTLTGPKIIKTNISVPTIPVGNQHLYFFPDRLIIFEGKQVGAIAYSNLRIEYANSRFIESEIVPSDSQIVGQTWKYVNKKGGPDRRFNDNRQLPIMLYSEIHFTSPEGLNELINLSKPNFGEQFSNVIKELAINHPSLQLPEVKETSKLSPTLD